MRMRTCREAAELLAEYGVDERSLRKGVQSGRYPHIMIGNRILVDVDVLAEIIANEAEAPAKHMLNTAELSEAIGLAEGAIRRGVSEGWIPVHVCGRVLRYDLDEVVEAITERMGR